jgi:hypothetical protein
MKTPVVLRDNYILYLELYDDLLWFHTDVRKWTAEINRKYKSDLGRLLDLVNMPLLAFIQKENNKLAKFAESIGFSKKETVMKDGNVTGYIYGLGY